MATQNDEWLQYTIDGCLNVCIQQGCCFPVLVIVTGSSGALRVVRYTEHENGQIHSHPLPACDGDSDLGSPANVMVIDALGRSVGLLLTRHPGCSERT